MKFWEAMKSLEEGKKVRHISWYDAHYLYIDNCGIVRHSIGGEEYKEVVDMHSEWELYDDRKEVPKIFKDLYKLINEIEGMKWNDDVYIQWVDSNYKENYVTPLYKQLSKINKEYKLDK